MAENADELINDLTKPKQTEDTKEQDPNAQIICRGCTAIFDYTCVDEQQQIWKGRPVFDPSSKDYGRWIFFSRRYDSVNSDIDRMIEEYEVFDESLIGVKFVLVPSQKILFFYEEPSTILRPQIRNDKMFGMR